MKTGRLKRWFILTAIFTTFSAFYITGGYIRFQRWYIDLYLSSLESFNELHHINSTSVSIYLENLDALDDFYAHSYSFLIKSKRKCVIPNGDCVFQTENPKADVLFKNARLHTPSFPERYCQRQILVVSNTEAESSCTSDALAMLRSAEIKIDHHLTSDVPYTEACFIPWKKELYKTPDPSGRKGVALLISNCEAKWRNDYILELSKYIHIYSYGKCFHNVTVPPSRQGGADAFQSITKKHRMVVTFENTIEKDYISEKISQCYKSGVIPVYWGPPEIYKWAPGNHTFIDPQKFKGPKELAEYLKRVDEDDDLFRYHTTNLDFERTEKMVDRYCCAGCPDVYTTQVMCKMCKVAQDLKLSRLIDGIIPPTC